MKNNTRLTIQELKWIKRMQKHAESCKLIPLFVLNDEGKIEKCLFYSQGGFLLEAHPIAKNESAPNTTVRDSEL